MDFGLSEAQQMLRTSAREFLETECPSQYVRDMEEDERGYTSEMWGKLVDQGWLGLVVPEEYGGVGMSYLDLCILLEEMGRALLPGPFFSTVVLGGMAVLDAGSQAQKQRFLSGIASGRTIMTLALTEPSARWDTTGVEATAAAVDGGYTISGTKLFIPNANTADYMIVAARTGEEDDAIGLFVVPRDSKGMSQTLLKTVSSDRQSEVVFDRVAAPSSGVLGDAQNGWPTVERILQLGAVGKCAEMVGGAQQVLDMTVEYAKQRVQFGRPIGSFQAVQHHCANMALDVGACRDITYQAAWRLSEGLPAAMDVAMAKSWVSDAYARVCALAHQCHGAIGFTREHDLQLYTRRAKGAEVAFGGAEYHRQAVATEMGL